MYAYLYNKFYFNVHHMLIKVDVNFGFWLQISIFLAILFACSWYIHNIIVLVILAY
jgi:hypothetical protein